MFDVFDQFVLTQCGSEFWMRSLTTKLAEIFFFMFQLVVCASLMSAFMLASQARQDLWQKATNCIYNTYFPILGPPTACYRHVKKLSILDNLISLGQR
jgi:hypothetical protein